MAFTYDPTTSRGQVRLIIGDTDTDTVANQLFTDAEVDAFLSMEDDVVKLAAAQALETIASRQALLQKKVKIGDLSTDGPAVAKALREHAAQLRASADGEVAFDYAELNVNGFSAREILRNEALRDLA